MMKMPNLHFKLKLSGATKKSLQLLELSVKAVRICFSSITKSTKILETECMILKNYDNIHTTLKYDDREH